MEFLASIKEGSMAKEKSNKTKVTKDQVSEESVASKKVKTTRLQTAEGWKRAVKAKSKKK